MKEREIRQNADNCEQGEAGYHCTWMSTTLDSIHANFKALSTLQFLSFCM